MSRDLLRRVSALEHRQPAAQYRANPEFLVAISDADLKFVAALPIYDEHGGPLDDAYARLSADERARLDDIFRRMRHGPDVTAEALSARAAPETQQMRGNGQQLRADPHREAHHG